ILRSNSASRSGTCYDKDPDCSNDICENYPYTAKERCPKFCGLCHHHSSTEFSSSHQQSSTLGSGIIEKGRKLLNSCVDKDSDCTAEICRNYPFTARDRCAKTCGLCSEDISSSTTSSHHTAIGIGKSKGGLPRTGNALINRGMCFDRKFDCRKETCRDFPFTAREECAKTCGFCTADVTSIPSMPSSSPGIAFDTMSRSHHASIRINERDGISASSGNGPISSGMCFDRKFDCRKETCRDFPFIAREECAKTCGFCTADVTSIPSLPPYSSGTAFSTISPSRYAFIRINERGGISASSGNGPISSGLCFDRKFDCRKETCRDFPFTAREECAKTCGFCTADVTSIPTLSPYSSDADFGTMSSNRHASIRRNERGGISASSGISHQSSKYNGFKTSHNTSSHSTLLKDKDLECVDLNIDCTQQTCKDYPFTARQRCAKTCGFCHKQPNAGGDTTNVGNRHSSLDRISAGSRTPELDRSDSSLRRNTLSATAGDCRDEDSQCSERSCLEQPYKAQTRCAKTCGFCGEKSSQGSMIDLESPSVDSSDDGIVITLESDDTDSSPPTATSGRPLTTGYGDDGTWAQNSQDSSISRRIDSSRRSSSSAHIQQSTKRPYLGAQRRYPGRTGPCSDENTYCEKEDCYKYPKFSQRYCEKTCNYC
ncbi:unnamed protein product, partial [Cercopithifilaria johnstoni]